MKNRKEVWSLGNKEGTVELHKLAGYIMRVPQLVFWAHYSVYESLLDTDVCKFQAV